MKKVLAILFCMICVLNARVVLDADGKEVQIPDKIERATPLIGAFAQMSAMLGEQEKIISAAPRLPEMMRKIFPKIQVSSNVSGSLNDSIETIIASKTQVVFGPLGALFDEGQRDKLNAAGIAVVNINKFSTPSEIKSSLAKIAEIFGGDAPKIANEFNAYFDENIAFVSNRVKDVKDKKRVLVLNHNSGNFSTIDANDIGAQYIVVAGGINVTDGLNKKDFKISRMINEEQVVAFDPDVIISYSHRAKEEILRNRSFANLKAVKNAQIFVVPSGVYLWSVRSAEGALQPLWLGKMLYPQNFTDLNLADKVKEFYKKFYYYDLSDDEVRNILEPK